MNKKNCWACQSELKTGQLVCLKCSSWQNWRRFLNVSNTTIALLVALISVISLLGAKIFEFSQKIWPLREAHISGHFDSSSKEVSLNVYNFGDVSVNMGSNIRCVFGLNNAMGHDTTEKGNEVEFWLSVGKIAPAGQLVKTIYIPKMDAFDAGQEQVLCFGALNYLGRTTPVEAFFLTIIPNERQTWWPVEAFFTTFDEIQRLYPRDISF